MVPQNVSRDSWEARMAGRARERAAAVKTLVETAKNEALNTPRPWLHGWPRLSGGRQVLIGVGVYCVCCGRPQGITCVAFPEDWEPPGPNPDWPFTPKDCPLCALIGWVRT